MSRYILIVEDDSDNKKLVNDIITGDGYRVENTSDAKSSFNFLLKGKPPSLIIFNSHDITDFLAMKSTNPDLSNIPIITTSYVQYEFPANVVSIKKPINADNLLLHVHNFMML